MKASSLWCTPAGFEVRHEEVPRPSCTEIVVRVQASSINPFDVKRAEGYGRRLLSVKKAGRLPRILGNDFAGVVEASGARARHFKEGDAVFGLVPTGPRGAHSSHVRVDARWARHSPINSAPESLAVVPYCFTTTWRAIHDAGLDRETARGRRVAIIGASGGLGQLAIRLLASWGAHVTAVAGASDHQLCTALGARDVVGREADWSSALARSYDAVLNFAAWEVDLAARSCLSPSAIGAATTVHPLVDNFDRKGWVSGAIASATELRAATARVRHESPRAVYSWTLFSPTPGALDALVESSYRLPVSAHYAFSNAKAAFSHARAGLRPGRVVLFPD